MNQINSNIKASLDEFIALDNPQYAIMIKGSWGCGKTYFIKDWISEVKKNSNGKKKPLYLSLYGMDNLSMVRDGLNKLLHPVLNHKFVKGLGKLANCATKATIKADFEIGDQKHDVNYALDFSSLLQTESKSNAAGKILVFDDLERCDVPIHVVLGFINFFVEQCACHVVIVCDDSKFNSEEKDEEESQPEIEGTKRFTDFKEKTIGKEYQIISSKEEAVSAFIKEVGSDPANVLSKNLGNIIEFLTTSKIENLRIVRQCILDFGQVVGSLDNVCYRALKYEQVMLQLLLNMIAVYSEQKAGNRIFESWDNLVHSFLPSDEERESYYALIKKYNKVPEKLGIEILGANDIKVIINYLKGGNYPVEVIKQKLIGDSANQNPWDRLLHFWNLSNSDFNAYYDATCESLKKGSYQYIEDLIKTVFVLINIENKGIRMIPDGAIDNAIETYKKMMESAKDYETLCKYKNFAVGRFNYYRIEKNTEKWHSFIAACEDIFNNLLKTHRSKAANLLESLSNETIEQLSLLQSQSVPDNMSNYDLAAMFHEIDANLVAQNIDKLNNESKTKFIDFLVGRYEIGIYSNSDCSLSGRKDQDIENLSKILEVLKDKQKTKTAVDKYVGNRLIEKLEIVVNYGKGHSSLSQIGL